MPAVSVYTCEGFIACVHALIPEKETTSIQGEKDSGVCACVYVSACARECVRVPVVCLWKEEGFSIIYRILLGDCFSTFDGKILKKQQKKKIL